MATTLKIGLAPKKVSYFEPKTRLYLTLDQPFKDLMVEDGADLSGIARGLFTMNPAIILLEGEFPEAEKEKFKAKYEIPFQVHKRTDMIVEKAPKAGGAPVAPEATVEGQSTEEATLFDVDAEPEEPVKVEPAEEKKPAAKKQTTKKKEA